MLEIIILLDRKVSSCLTSKELSRELSHWDSLPEIYPHRHLVTSALMVPGGTIIVPISNRPQHYQCGVVFVNIQKIGGVLTSRLQTVFKRKS